MVRRPSQVHTKPRSFLPLWNALSGGQAVVEDERWASKWVVMAKDCWRVASRKSLVCNSSGHFVRRCVEGLVCLAQSVRPHVGGDDDVGPLGFGMHEHCCCLLLEVPDSLLSHPVLKVGIDPTVGDRLSALCNVINKPFVRKSTIVSVVVSYCHSPRFAKFLKRDLALDGFVGSQCLL